MSNLLAYGDQVIGGGSSSGGSGGHVIQDASGTAVVQEPAMQFADSHVSDDSTNEKTVIENIKPLTRAQFDVVTEDGFYAITDEDDATMEDTSADYVEVVADGVKTYAQLFAELWTKIDTSKVTDGAFLSLDRSNPYSAFYTLRSATSSAVSFVKVNANTSNPYVTIEMVYISANFNALRISNPSSYSDADSNVKPTQGTKITLYYGTDSCVTNLINQAKYTYMESGESVESAVNKSKWSNLITLNEKVKYRYNDNLLIVYPTGTETSLGTWSTVTLGTLPTNIFTVLNNSNSNGIIDGGTHTLKRGTFLVNVSGEVKLTAWEDALTGGSQATIGNSGIIVPIQLV